MTKLPHRDSDPILRLHAHYFELADLMRGHANAIDREYYRRGRLSKKKNVTYAHYVITWLGFLYVVLEGIAEIQKSGILDNLPESFSSFKTRLSIISRCETDYIDRLRRFRNGTFHYQFTPDKQLQFLENDSETLRISKDLHNNLKDLFSDYRVNCMVVYAIEGRKDEVFW
ncbi:hypothetical protein [Azospirillum tabaci]|uniref:hypothetical protein n=1 Tax=Azospirillum tabaci TaxID=2752310 RepID=UPI001660B5DD|nr:hypothetical protein [Azospirillum tabaci]